ncbi:response regulator [Pleurocapsa sp. CCALA 161]|uniref:response regulator n=1 Tax=Pleurocapsa sp. CCALA 161 TaxID=2107688 RepID=UPI001304B48B|nr:response regulator [Pleurocapsa sp. CCALA 161]
MAAFGTAEYFGARNNHKIVNQIANSYTEKISDRLLSHLDSNEAAIDPNSKATQVQSLEGRLDRYLSELDPGYTLKIAVIEPNGSIISSNLPKIKANSQISDQNIRHYFPLNLNSFSDFNQAYKFSFKIKQQRFLGQATPWQSQTIGLSWLVVTIPESELTTESVKENYLSSWHAYVIYLLSAIALGILNYAWLSFFINKQNGSPEQQIASNSDTSHEIEPPAVVELPNHQSDLLVEKAQVDCEPYNLLADMSHELRSPLNAILGFAQIMEQELSTNQTGQENIAIINRSGERLLSIINDLVDLAKIETNRLTLEDNKIDFHDWLDNIEQSFKFQAHNQDWEFSLIRQHDLPQWICVDERRLRQILRNLINYCLKSKPTSDVSLRVSSSISRHETVDPNQPNSTQKYHLVFEVENTNLSVTEVELATLFHPLVTVRQEVNLTEGSSLNLPISRKLAQLMGGDITVSNNQPLKSGLTFNLKIQTQSVAAQKLQVQSGLRRVIGLESDKTEYRILIVDDSKTNRAIMKRFLEPVGFKVQEAVNGQEAIDVWLRWQPHMIWMDLRMPVMNGCEATKRIKSYSQALYTPIVALSASTLEEDKSLFKAAGCDDFVSKPFSENVIFDKIAQHLGIRYVYESISPLISNTTSNFKLTADTLNIMSSEWRNNLEQAATVLDQDLLTQLLQKIPPEHYSLKDSLQKQVNDFDFDKIISLVKKSKSN